MLRKIAYLFADGFLAKIHCVEYLLKLCLKIKNFEKNILTYITSREKVLDEWKYSSRITRHFKIR